MATQFLISGGVAIGNLRTDEPHLRISMIDDHNHDLEHGITIIPLVSMGLREDGKLGESFLGMEVGGRIGFTSTHGYEISTKSEVLLSGTDQVQEWGLSGQLSYDSASDGPGVQLSVVPEWGRSMLVAGNILWGDGVLVEDFDSKLHTDGPGSMQRSATVSPYGRIWVASSRMAECSFPRSRRTNPVWAPS